MSAYLLLASHSASALSLRRQGKSSAPNSRTLSRRSSVQSSSHSSVSSAPTRTKRYDMATNSYVTMRKPALGSDPEVVAYQAEKDRLARNPHYADNLALSQQQVSGRMLFSARNLTLLRHTFFESFLIDDSFMPPDNHAHARGTARIHETHSKPKQPTNHTKSAAPTAGASNNGTSVRAVLQSSRFWNDVYQDLKFRSSSGINYFDLMSSTAHCKTFFAAAIHHFLSHVEVLLPPESLLHHHEFVHLADTDYAWFATMGKVHVQLFATQQQMCSYFGQRASVPDTQAAAVQVHQQLLAVLVHTMVENLRLTPELAAAGMRRTHLFALWEHFLTVLMTLLIFTADLRNAFMELISPTTARKTKNEFPSPNLDEEHTHSCVESISSKNTDPASLMSTMHNLTASSPISDLEPPLDVIDEPDELDPKTKSPAPVAGPSRRLILKLFKKR